MVSVGEPGLLVLARLDDKHFVVCKHLGEAVSEDLAHVDVNLVHLQLLLITLDPRVLIAAGVLFHLQLLCVASINTDRENTKIRKGG